MTNRDRGLYVRLSTEELEDIKAAARAAGMTVSEHVRARCCSGLGAVSRYTGALLPTHHNPPHPKGEGG